jgi:hypothetical protein
LEVLYLFVDDMIVFLLDERKIGIMRLMRFVVEFMDEEWISSGISIVGELEESLDERVRDTATLLMLSLLKKKGEIGGKGTVSFLVSEKEREKVEKEREKSEKERELAEKEQMRRALEQVNAEKEREKC